MVKNGKKDSAFIDDPQRCEICDTTLTLYPKTFAPCPCCQKRICRRCWGGTWELKAFVQEKCNHLLDNDGQTLSSVETGKLQWDWHRTLFAVVLGGLAAGILVFLYYLFS